MAPDSIIMLISDVYRDLDPPELRREIHQILPAIRPVEMICVAIDRHQVVNIHLAMRKILSTSVGETVVSFSMDIYPITTIENRKK